METFNNIKSEIENLIILANSENFYVSKKKKIKVKIKSNISKQKFLKNVIKAKKYKKKGDIFQVVLSQRFKAKLEKEPIEVYKKLRVTNPSPFMYFSILMIFK